MTSCKHEGLKMQRGVGSIALAASLLAVLLIAPLSVAQDETEERSAANNDFGSLELPMNGRVTDQPTEFAASVVLEPQPTPWMVLFAFQVHSDALLLEFLGLSLSDGTPINVDREEVGKGGTEYKALVAGESLPPAGEPILMQASLTARQNGQFRLAALVIGFTPGFEKAQTPSGGSAELYRDTLVHSTGVAGGVLDPPFEGSGNLPSWGALATGVAAAAAAVLIRRRN